MRRFRALASCLSSKDSLCASSPRESSPFISSRSALWASNLLRFGMAKKGAPMVTARPMSSMVSRPSCPGIFERLVEPVLRRSLASLASVE